MVEEPTALTDQSKTHEADGRLSPASVSSKETIEFEQQMRRASERATLLNASKWEKKLE